MTVLVSLQRYYERLAARGDADPPGYSREIIGVGIWLAADGAVIDVTDFCARGDKPGFGVQMSVPQAVIRTSGIVSNFLWDKTSYALGVTSGHTRRTEAEHAAFKTLHKSLLKESDDPGMRALLACLDHWRPEDFFTDSRFNADMLDRNVVFGLGPTNPFYLHDRPDAHVIAAATCIESLDHRTCLVTGERTPIARLHPPIKGVPGAQPSGARLVSCNADAFVSYGIDDSAVASVGSETTFRYSSALNRLLARNSRNRLKIGDGTALFWAEADGGEAAAAAAEDAFVALADPKAGGDAQTRSASLLGTLRARRALTELDPNLNPATRFQILNLAPNAGRLSIRYWLRTDLGGLAAALGQHYDDLAIEPAPWDDSLPSLRTLLVKTTAAMESIENIPPRLAGDFARAAFEGRPYPRALLSVVMMRLRASESPAKGWHAAVIKACINRLEKEKLPVARDTECSEISYHLGRLFAVMGAAQYAALGRVNTNVTDRYFRSASATPGRVFGTLLARARNHVADANRRGRGLWLEKRLNEIMDRLPPQIPNSLTLTEQGRFAVGYYHERSWRGDSRPTEATEDVSEMPADS